MEEQKTTPMSEIKSSKVEIHQINGEKGIFTEILIDGHKLHGVRSYALKQEPGNSIPTLTIDLNAFDFSVDVQMLRLNQKGYGPIRSIKFKKSYGFSDVTFVTEDDFK